MKSLKLVLGICLMVVFLISCKTIEVNVVKQSTVSEMAYSYVDIDPIVIGQTWEEVIKVPINMYVTEIYFRNPDTDAPIQFATLVVMPGGIGGYSYIVDGQIYVYGFFPETNSYKSVWEDFEEDVKQLWYEDYENYFGLSNA